MKKSRIFFIMAALILTTAGFLSAKANRKYTGLSVAYGIIGGWSFTLHIGHSAFTTVKGILKTVMIKTVGNTKLSTLFSTPLLVNRVYYF